MLFFLCFCQLLDPIHSYLASQSILTDSAIDEMSAHMNDWIVRQKGSAQALQLFKKVSSKNLDPFEEDRDNEKVLKSSQEGPPNPSRYSSTEPVSLQAPLSHSTSTALPDTLEDLLQNLQSSTTGKASPFGRTLLSAHKESITDSTPNHSQLQDIYSQYLHDELVAEVRSLPGIPSNFLSRCSLTNMESLKTNQ